MNYAILFSGGYDSTYAVLQLLTDIKDGKLPYDYSSEITLISINADATGTHKNKRETKARKDIIKWMNTKFERIKLTQIEINISMQNNIRKSDGLTQPIIWYANSMLYLNKDTILISSYIRTDDAFHCKREIMDFVENMAKISIKNIKLKFPLESLYKEEILMRLMDEEDLYKMCTSCECICNDDHCGHCHPCRNTIIALNNILLFHNDKHSFVRQELKKFGIESNFVLPTESDELPTIKEIDELPSSAEIVQSFISDLFYPKEDVKIISDTFIKDKKARKPSTEGSEVKRLFKEYISKRFTKEQLSVAEFSSKSFIVKYLKDNHPEYTYKRPHYSDDEANAYTFQGLVVDYNK